MSTTKQPAIIISSCDNYNDAWPPFFELLFRYWTDCPWPIYLISNKETVEDPRVTTFALGEDLGWASNLKNVLNQIDCSSIIYLQEDYFLQNPVDTKKLIEVVQYAEQSNTGYIRLSGLPEPDLKHDNPFGLGELSKNAAYRCSLQAAWWNLDVLNQLLIEGETGWDMEKKGNDRSAKLEEKFLAIQRDQPLLDYYFDTAILKGQWMPGAIDLCKREGVAIDLSRRPIRSRWPLAWKTFRKSLLIHTMRNHFRKMTGRPLKTRGPQ